MSLFPAYSASVIEHEEVNHKIDDATNKINKGQNWLQNSSYQEISTLVTGLQNNDWTDSSEDELCIINTTKDNIVVRKNAVQNEKKKNFKSKKKLSKKYETIIKGVYFEDKKRNKMFTTIDTLGHKMRPSYKLSHLRLGLNLNKKNKRKIFSRYHAIVSSKKKRKLDNSVELNEDALEIMNFIKSQENKMEIQRKESIEEYNKKLAENPKDIHTWLEYINYQDHVVQLQKFSKNSNQKHLSNEKKLSIVEKALVDNKDSTELLKIKFQLLSQMLPADEFSSQIESLIQKDPKNFVLWQVLMLIIQTSCSLCKVSKVLHYYVKCFTILKQRSKTDAKFYDEQVLSLLFQCLIFLRHAGLWEQMWEVIKINLCLNLTVDQEILEKINVIDEENLMNMEELILSSQLPLNQLWLRTESLRESCYWTGIDINKADISLIGDEKRLVSAEETNDFIYPTISKKSDFRIAVLFILCLKVPLLPSRHYTLKDFKLDELFWSVDSLEFILPMIYSTISTANLNSYMFDESMLKDLLEGNLTSGPQFLKFHPAQELYLDFVRLVFKTVAQKLTGDEKTSILIWWLKFERLLVFITKNDPLIDKNRNKKLKSIIKNFLKEPENRSNLHYYREFAMIEYELGSFDTCIQMLKKIVLLQDVNNVDHKEKLALLSLYRTLFEVISNTNRFDESNLEIFQETLKSFKNFLVACFEHDPNSSLKEILYNEILKFFVVTPEDEAEESFLLSNIYCDILMCYSYLILAESLDDSDDILDLFDRCLTHTNNCFRLNERLYETKLSLIQFIQKKSKKKFENYKKTIDEALEKYPNNFFFLSGNSLIEIEQPFWKINVSSGKFNIWSTMATCLAGRARINYLKKLDLKVTEKAMINKMIAFHNKVSKTQEIQGCPLIWRFYMLLVREHGLCEKKGENIYYEAISQCPWARSVYISAAEIAPQILSQIQDLINEKELRMHVTPEELDILRE